MTPRQSAPLPASVVRPPGGVLPAKGRLGVAFSGGADSLALVVLLCRWLGEEEARKRLCLLHIDHAARPESGDDAAWVAAWAAGRGLPCLVERLAPPPARPRDGFEAWARRARYAVLARLQREQDLVAVCTGHSRDDQTETVLLRLLRGTSPLGLRGMLPRRRLLTTAGSLLLLRPLLGCSRADLRTVLAQLGETTWREDPSNQDQRYLRNRLRLDLLPQLEALRAGFGARLAALADDLRRVAATHERAAARCLQRCQRPDGLHLQPPPPARLLPEMLRRWLLGVPGFDARRLDRRLLARLLDLCRRRQRGRKVELDRDRLVVRTREGLSLVPRGT